MHLGGGEALKQGRRGQRHRGGARHSISCSCCFRSERASADFPLCCACTTSRVSLRCWWIPSCGPPLSLRFCFSTPPNVRHAGSVDFYALLCFHIFFCGLDHLGVFNREDMQAAKQGTILLWWHTAIAPIAAQQRVCQTAQVSGSRQPLQQHLAVVVLGMGCSLNAAAQSCTKATRCNTGWLYGGT